MKPTRVTVSYGEKRSANYQSVDAQVTLEYEVESAEEAKAAYYLAKNTAIKAVKAILGPQIAAPE